MQDFRQEKSPIKRRILQLIDCKGISQYEFYQKTGITRGILAQNNGISEDNITRFLAYFPEVSPEWLLTGVGEMLKKEEDQCQVKKVPAKSDPAGMPLIPIEAVAGWNGIDGPGIKLSECERYYIPDFATAGAEYLIRASGSSMYPKYSSGDILACRKIQEITFFQWGKIYVIDSAQGAMVKRIFPCENSSDSVTCMSDNERYPAFDLPKSEIRSLSIVIGVIRLE